MTSGSGAAIGLLQPDDKGRCILSTYILFLFFFFPLITVSDMRNHVGAIVIARNQALQRYLPRLHSIGDLTPASENTSGIRTYCLQHTQLRTL
jgi:hypothetical protein